MVEGRRSSPGARLDSRLRRAQAEVVGSFDQVDLASRGHAENDSFAAWKRTLARPGGSSALPARAAGHHSLGGGTAKTRLASTAPKPEKAVVASKLGAQKILAI
jgi:hypothetical protein